MSDSDSEREQSTILGPISREERARLFEEFIKDSSDLHRVEARSTTWTDPNILLEVVDGSTEENEITRTYFYMDHTKHFHEAAKFTRGPQGIRLYVIGSNGGPSFEGKQTLNFADNGSLEVEIEERDTELSLIYDETGKLISVDFKPSRDEAVKGLHQGMRLNEMYSPFQRKDFGSRQVLEVWNYDDQNHLTCGQYDKESGIDRKMDHGYKIPKYVSITECIGKLIPQELIEEPYHAPTRADRWRTADFLGVIGGERREPPPSNIKL